MWLAILFTALAVIGVATGNFLSGAVFLAIAGIALIFNYEKQDEAWGWIKSTGLPFVWEHLAMIWFIVSLIGVIWTTMFGGPIVAYVVSAVLAGLTQFKQWEGIFAWIGKLLTGEFGVGRAWVIWAMVLAFIAWVLREVSHEQYNAGAGLIFGLAICMFTFGILTGVKGNVDKK